jgi:hypothetical protein
MQAHSSTIGFGWVSHDAWSEMYLACLRQCAQLERPSSPRHPVDSAVAQLVVVGAHHLVEFALFGLLRKFVFSISTKGMALTEERFDELPYAEALHVWAPEAIGGALPIASEPLASAEALRKHRNAVVHKSSALTRTTWARPALYTAVEATRALYVAFDTRFPYRTVLGQNPVACSMHFSQAISAEPI